MARLLAVDWDQYEARFVLANLRGKSVKVVLAESVPLVDVAEGGGEPKPDLAASLAGALARHKVGRIKALVGVQRSSIELLELTLPPAKDEELPEMVANLAIRESSSISDDWVIDFVPRDRMASAPRQLTAAAIAPDAMDRLKDECQAAGITPLRMLLRPFATASLFLTKGPAPDGPVVLVDCVGAEADLVVISEGTVVFSRTIRLPEHVPESETSQRLVTEIKRTLAVAAPHELGGGEIQNVYVLGGPGDHLDVIEGIGQELSLPAAPFDPFAALGVKENRVPPSRGRFAPLLGMLVDEALGRHAMDFLHPRRMPRPVSRWRIAAMAGGVAAAAVLALAFHLWSTLSDIERVNTELAERVDQLNEGIKKARQQKVRIEAIADWKASEVIWLDELRDLSLRFPSARDVVVLRMSLRPSQTRGGMVDLQGLVRDPNVVVNLETRLRDPYRRVRSRRVQERTIERDYTWSFESTISVARRPKEQYVSHLPESQKPPQTPETLAASAPTDPKQDAP